jgi:hypothetical protein
MLLHTPPGSVPLSGSKVIVIIDEASIVLAGIGWVRLIAW